MIKWRCPNCDTLNEWWRTECQVPVCRHGRSTLLAFWKERSSFASALLLFLLVIGGIGVAAGVLSHKTNPPPTPPLTDSGPLPAVKSTPFPKAAPPAPPAKQFIIYPNRDIQGGDYQSFRGIDLSDCEPRCRADARCIAYSYDRWNRWCFLKEGLTPLRIEPRSISGVRDDLQTSSASDELRMEEYHGKYFPDDPYDTMFNSSRLACKSTCKSATYCIAYSFFKASHQCKLFKVTGPYFPDASVDSGVKTQSLQ
jgi:hypothetical protein